MLIIEVEDIKHHWDETILKDKKKQADLEAAGFTVLRFKDEEVLNDLMRSMLFWKTGLKRKYVAKLSPPPFEISFGSKYFPRPDSYRVGQ